MIHKRHRDGADSTVSALIVMPFIVMIFILIVDFGVFGINRAIMQNTAQAAARTVSIYGGAGTAYLATPIEKAYGNNDSCKLVEQDIAKGGKYSILRNAYKSTSTPTECALMHNIEVNSGVVNIEVNDVSCTPSYTATVGAPVRCSVKWSYKGIPGSALSAIKVGENVLTVGTAESEVRFDSTDMVSR